jgi:hypothetical protein
MFYPENSTASYKRIFKWLEPSFKTIFWLSLFKELDALLPLAEYPSSSHVFQVCWREMTTNEIYTFNCFLYASDILYYVVFMVMVTCAVV